MPNYLKEIILGGQDGLVNVLGIILAMAAATNEVRLIIIAGLAATFAESLSMGAVGYTSTRAIKDLYNRRLKEETKESEENILEARQEIELIYKKKGFSGKLLGQIVDKIASNKKVLVDTMMKEELNLSLDGFEHPIINALIIGFAAIIGSLIPLMPFFFPISINLGMLLALVFSVIALFITGAYKAKLTNGRWFKEGLELAFVGMSAAIIGYLLGVVIGKIF